jgi:hypothetical protein
MTQKQIEFWRVSGEKPEVLAFHYRIEGTTPSKMTAVMFETSGTSIRVVRVRTTRQFSKRLTVGLLVPVCKT